MHHALQMPESSEISSDIYIVTPAVNSDIRHSKAKLKGGWFRSLGEEDCWGGGV
jgi:hypothetical protein